MLRVFTFLCITCIVASCNDSKLPLKIASIDLTKTKNITTEKVETVKYNAEDSIADSKVRKYKVRLVEGVNKKGGYTKVKYLNTLQLIKINRKDANTQQWEDKILTSKINYLKDNNVGGRLELIAIRSNIDSANFKNFTVLIKDLNEKELFRKNLPASVALPSRINKHVWNTQKIDVPQKIRPPFYVYVIEKHSQKPLKFSVVAK